MAFIHVQRSAEPHGATKYEFCAPRFSNFAHIQGTMRVRMDFGMERLGGLFEPAPEAHPSQAPTWALRGHTPNADSVKSIILTCLYLAI